MHKSYGKFTPEAISAIDTAYFEAARTGSAYVGSEHLLLALSLTGATGDILRRASLDACTLRERLATDSDCNECTDITPRLRTLLHKAVEKASGRKVDTVTLLEILISEDCFASRLAADSAVYIMKEISMAKAKTERFPTPLLDKCGLDLTEKARQGKIDPCIGREAEEELIIRILLRKTKNNPCLVGEAGVGKTAVAEGLAMRIAEGRVPEPLQNMRLVAIDIPSLVAGTKYRGEFEDKLHGIIDEIKQNGSIILFADEIHTVVGAGAAEGAIDASNILKPYLARGEIRLMGATTPEEYAKYIEKDKALDRRFQTVTLAEPSEEECLYILRGIRRSYEQFHGIDISDEALSAAVELSVRYISNRFLPDKAIDLLDEAASMKRMYSKSKKNARLCREDISVAVERFTGKPLMKPLTALTEEIKQLVFGQDAAVQKAVAAVYKARRSGKGSSILLCGAPCCGKTALAESIAEKMFGKSSFVKLNLANYTGSIAEKIRKKPCSLVLLENADRAPEHRMALSELLNDGKLTDNDGTVTKTDGCVFILTATAAEKVGFVNGSTKSSLSEQVALTVQLAPQSAESLTGVASALLKKAKESLAACGKSLEHDKSFAACLAEECIESRQNARQLKQRLDSMLAPLFAPEAPKIARLSSDNLKIPVKNS